jgi:hypothetical protein
MDNRLSHIKDRLRAFYNDGMSLPDIESRMGDFLNKELMNDFIEKKIKNFQDWLKYYSTEGNNFEDIVRLTESYYYKVLRQDLLSITLEEKVVIYNAIALYCTEMDVEKPTGSLFNKIVRTFIEIVRHYNLYLKGFVSLRGEVSISNREKIQFFSVWKDASYTKEVPITLFSPHE